MAATARRTPNAIGEEASPAAVCLCAARSHSIGLTAHQSVRRGIGPSVVAIDGDDCFVVLRRRFGGVMTELLLQIAAGSRQQCKRTDRREASAIRTAVEEVTFQHRCVRPPLVCCRPLLSGSSVPISAASMCALIFVGSRRHRERSSSAADVVGEPPRRSKITPPLGSSQPMKSRCLPDSRTTGLAMYQPAGTTTGSSRRCCLAHKIDASRMPSSPSARPSGTTSTEKPVSKVLYPILTGAGFVIHDKELRGGFRNHTEEHV